LTVLHAHGSNATFIDRRAFGKKDK